MAVHTSDGVQATVTEVKWRKSRTLVEEIRDMLHSSSELPHKRLEQIRGFLIYAARSYRWMTPYLKGIHHTLESWRPDRDHEGYKQKLEWDGWLQEKEGWKALDQAPKYDPSKPPPTVSAVPRLSDDVTALLEFLPSDEPATQDCRSQKALVALYLLGDASGDGLGNAF